MDPSLNQNNLSTAALLIGYKRIEFIKKRLVELSQNTQIPIIVSIDGSDTLTEKSIVLFLKEFISKNPSMDVRYKIQDMNLGLAKHIVRAITEVFHQFDQVIVIEDDILLSDSFINNMLLGLDILGKSSEYGVVCGFSGFKGDFILTSPVRWRASKYFSPWGWAINAKNWGKFNIHIPKEFRQELENSVSWNSLSSYRRKLWESRFTKVQSDNPHTWDFQMQYFLYKYDLDALHTTKRISDNEGFGSIESTNTQADRPKWMSRIYVENIQMERRFIRHSLIYEAVDAITVGGDDRLFRSVRKIFGFLK